MPQNLESSIPLDDDDILDLTEIAEPGKASSGPPEPGDGSGIDFGADLDALLDSLAPDGTTSSPAASSPRMAATESPVAAPIKDQTPVLHTVDPNEEMSMPETSDIDSLLAELGANIPADSPEPPEVRKQEVKAAAPAPDFDGLLAQARAAEAQKAAEEEAKEMAAIVASAGKVTPPAQQPEPAAVALEPEADDADSLDLNELDALLDDILATAPEMRSSTQAVQTAQTAPAATVEPVVPAVPMEPAAPAIAAGSAVPEEEDGPAVIAVPDGALMPADAPDPSFEARVRRLEEAVEVVETGVANQFSEDEINTLIDAKLAAFSAPVPEEEPAKGLSEEDVAALIDAKLAAFPAPVPEEEPAKGLSGEDVAALIDAKLAAFSVPVPEEPAKGLSGEDVAALIDTKLSALLAPGSDTLLKIVEQVLAQLAAPDAISESSAELRGKLEKMAAAAAAKVIREEIAALTGGQG